MCVVALRPDGIPHRFPSKRSAVFGCAPARLNCPGSPTLRQAVPSRRRSRSRAATSPTLSHWIAPSPSRESRSSRSASTKRTAPAQSSPTCARSEKALRAETWNCLAQRSRTRSLSGRRPRRNGCTVACACSAAASRRALTYADVYDRLHYRYSLAAAFTLLERHGVIDADLATKMRQAMGFR